MLSFNHPSANRIRDLPEHDHCVLLVLGFNKDWCERLFKATEKLHLVVFDPEIDASKITGGSNFQLFSDFWNMGKHFPFVLSRRYGLRLEALPGAKTRWPREWAQLLEFCVKQKQNMNSDIVTAARFAYEWQRNTLLNLRHFKTSGKVSDWFGSLEAKTGVLVASGPSLDDSIDDLRRLRDKAFLLAVGSAAPRLEDEGIRPDAVIAFDGGVANWIGHFETMNLDCPLVYDPIVYHRIPETWRGPKVAMQIWPFQFYERTLGELGLVEVGPSVANTGFDLLFKMGCDPIVLVGQDLGYRGEQIHASGTHRSRLCEALRTTNYDPVSVPRVGGGQIASNIVFKTFLNTFECRIQAAKRKRPLRVINTSFGAQIPETENLPLSKIAGSAIEKPNGNSAPPDVSKLVDLLKKTREAAGEVYRKAEAKTYPHDLVQALLEPLSFVLQPVWNNARCETDREWAVAETRAGLRYALPLLEQSIERLEAA